MLPCEPLARTLHSCHNLMNGCTSSHQEWAVLTGFHVLVDVSCTVYPFLSSRCFPTSFWQGLLNVFVFSHNTWNFARVLASCHMSWRARSAHPLRPFNDIFKDYQASLRAAVRTLIPASRPQMIQRRPTPHFSHSTNLPIPPSSWMPPRSICSTNLAPSAFTAPTFFSINLHLLLSNMPCSNTTRPAACPRHPPSTSSGSIHGSPPPAPASDLRTYGFDLKSIGKGTVLIATTRRSMKSHFGG